jgi:hypothetical protein
MSKRTFEIIRQTITEIMTPERFRRFREDVKNTAEAWLQARQKGAAALQAWTKISTRKASLSWLLFSASFTIWIKSISLPPRTRKAALNPADRYPEKFFPIV